MHGLGGKRNDWLALPGRGRGRTRPWARMCMYCWKPGDSLLKLSAVGAASLGSGFGAGAAGGNAVGAGTAGAGGRGLMSKRGGGQDECFSGACCSNPYCSPANGVAGHAGAGPGQVAPCRLAGGGNREPVRAPGAPWLNACWPEPKPKCGRFRAGGDGACTERARAGCRRGADECRPAVAETDRLSNSGSSWFAGGPA